MEKNVLKVHITSKHTLIWGWWELYIGVLQIPVDVENRIPSVEWSLLWRNQGVVIWQGSCHTHTIGNLTSSNCETCGVPDTNMHRIRECRSSFEVRQWTKKILSERIRVHCERIEDFLKWNINMTNEQESTELWLPMQRITWCISGEVNSGL